MRLLNNTTIENETDAGVELYIESKELREFRLVLFSVIILASLIGNSMVCYAVWQKTRKPLSYCLVANMAFAEILSSLCLPVLLATRETTPNTHHVLIEARCILNPLQVLSGLVVVYSLAAIAFLRYRIMVGPNPRGPTKKVKILTIAGVWLVSLAISIPLFIGLKFENGQCNERPVASNEVYVLIKFILNYALPYVIMVASYGAVAWNLRKRIVEKTIQNRTSIIPSSCVVESEDHLELHDLANQATEVNRFRNERRRVLVDESNRRGSRPENTDPEKDLLKMIFALIIVFVVCYFPYQASFLWARIYKINSWQFRYHLLMDQYVFILICLPGALHPLCYGTMNSFLAKAFLKIILCRSKNSRRV